jgi:hypothetical protein
MRNLVVFIPFILSTYLIMKHGVFRAVIDVYLPCLILIPGAYHIRISGFPDINFHHSAVLPILIYSVCTGRFKMKCLLFWILFFFAILRIYSEGVSAGFYNARFQGFNDFAYLLGPYAIARYVINDREKIIAIIKRLVGLCALSVVFLQYDAFMYSNFQHRVLDSFFPGQWHKSGSGFRFGLPRLNGAFNHAIAMGLAFMTAIAFFLWLKKNKYIEGYFKFMPLIKKSHLILFALLLGEFYTGSRAPWIGTLMVIFISAIDFSKARFVSFLTRATILILFSIIGFQTIRYFGTTESHTHLAETIRYRWELWSDYQPFIDEKPYLGWGIIKGGLGLVPKKPSIDNFFLYTAVTSGYTGLYLMILLFITLISKFMFNCIYFLFRNQREGRMEFTSLGIIIAFCFALQTVWMDGQFAQLFYILIATLENYFDLSRKKAFPLSVRHAKDANKAKFALVKRYIPSFPTRQNHAPASPSIPN